MSDMSSVMAGATEVVGDAEMIGIGDLRMTEADSDGRVTYEVFTQFLEPRMSA